MIPPQVSTAEVATVNTERDFDQLAHWAEHDMTLPENSTTAVRGPDAAAIGRELLERVGRPALDPDAEPGTESPRRQVRLPQPLSNQVNELAQRQGRKPAALMRDAIAEYVRTHSGEDRAAG